jgi:hypothetical protein
VETFAQLLPGSGWGQVAGPIPTLLVDAPSVGKLNVMPQIPEIEVPMWRRLSSGLIVPSSIASEVRGSAHHTHDLPPDLRPPPQAVAVLDHLPSSVDQFLARPNERVLDLTPSDLEYLVGETSEIPFEPAMLAISRLAAANWHIPRDRDAQLELANGFFDGAPIVHQLSRWARAEEGRVIFSEQQFFVVQRLLVEHARDGAIGDGMAEGEFARLKRLILGAATIVDDSHFDLEQAAGLGEEMLAYLIQNGAYHSRQNMLNAFARAYSLFVEHARARADDLPLDQWVAEDHALTLEEQFAAGNALQTVSRANEDDVQPGQRSLVEPDALRTTSFRDRMDDVRGMLVGSRDWYCEAFAGAGDLTSIAWETTPFMQRPFLELSSGQLVLISPRSIISWLGDGFYYRLLEAAQRRNTPEREMSLAYTELVGELLEEWALELVRSVYAGERPPGGGRVFGEQRYGDNLLTPDVAIDFGTDLVLIEVRSGYLNRRLRVSGQVDEFRRDLERVVLRKVRQIGDRIGDLLAGRAHIGDIDVAHVERIWPILVTADMTQLEPLHDVIHAALPESYGDPRVQQPLVCDPEDLEVLMGMVEGGASLVDILERRQNGPFAKLELKRWVLEDPGSPGEERPSYALERWDRVTAAVRGVLQLEE